MPKKNEGISILAAGLATAACLLLGSWLWIQDPATLMPALLVVIPALTALWLTAGHLQRIGAERDASEQALAGLKETLDANAKTFGAELATAGSAWQESRNQALIEIKREVSVPLASLQEAWRTTSAAQAENYRAEREESTKQTRIAMETAAGNYQELVNSQRISLAAWKEESEVREASSRSVAEEMRTSIRQTLETAAASITECADHQLQASITANEEMRAALAVGRAEAQAAWERQNRLLQEQAAEAQAVAGSLEALQARTEAGIRQTLETAAASIIERADRQLQASITANEEMRTAWVASRAETEAAWERHGRLLQEQAAESQAVLARELDEARKSAHAEAGRVLEAQSQVETEIRRTMETSAALIGTSADRHLAALAQAGEEMRASWTSNVAQTEAAWDRRAQSLQEQAAEAEAALTRELGEARKLAFADATRILDVQGQSSLELEAKSAKLAEQSLQSSHDLKEIAHLSRVNQTEMQAGVGMLNAGLASLLERLERQSEVGHEQQALLAELGRGLSAFEQRAAEILVENAMKTQEILMDVLPLAGHKHGTELAHPASERAAA